MSEPGGPPPPAPAPTPRPDVREMIDIAAAPAVVYGIVSDVTGVGRWAVECERGRWLPPATGAGVGARFRGHNRRGARRWSTVSTVTAAEPGAAFAYRVRAAGLFGVAEWRFEITPRAGGCRVEQSWYDQRGLVMRVVGRLATGVADRAAHNAANMRASLTGLKALAESRPS